jgi:predicted nucleic acid-binding protein
MIAIDASVAVKWYRPEHFSLEATALFETNAGDLIAPDMFAVEVTSALVRNANAVKAARNIMEQSILAFARELEIGSIRLTRLTAKGLTDAARLALDLGHPLKDCNYLALAMEQGCDLVTCDARFAAKAKRVWAGVRVLGG